MRDLDETDLEILRLLTEHGRRPFNEIAEAVDLSPPTVSDRVDRLQELGVIRRFTVNVDRSVLREGTPVLVHLSLDPARVDAAKDALANAEDVEHIFTTANATVTFHANLPTEDVRTWLLATVDPDSIRSYDVDLLSDVEWTPTVEGTAFALQCAECGNTVTDEGVTATIGGETKQFCCPTCESRYQERYDELTEEVER